MKKLYIDKCEITREHFVPNVIMDKSLYSDIDIETGVLKCDIHCSKDEDEQKKKVTKFVMMLEAYNDGYVKAIDGERYGLTHVFAIIGKPMTTYIGDKTLHIEVKVITLVYNPYLHMTAVNECLIAGATTSLMPDSRNYFTLDMDDKLVEYEGYERPLDLLEGQKDKFQHAMVDNMKQLAHQLNL